MLASNGERAGEIKKLGELRLRSRRCWWRRFAWIQPGWCWIFANKPRVFANFTSVLADEPSIFANISGVLANEPSIFANISGVFANVPSVFTDESSVFTDVSGLLANVTSLLANVTGLLADVTSLLADVSGLFADVSGLLADISGLLANLTGLLANLTAILADRRDVVTVSFTDVADLLPEWTTIFSASAEHVAGARRGGGGKVKVKIDDEHKHIKYRTHKIQKKKNKKDTRLLANYISRTKRNGLRVKQREKRGVINRSMKRCFEPFSLARKTTKRREQQY